MANNPFQRFKQKESGARKKEKIRQEKKKARLETKEYFAQKKKGAREGFTSSISPDEHAVINRSEPKSTKPADKKKFVIPPKKNVSQSLPPRPQQKPNTFNKPKTLATKKPGDEHSVSKNVGLPPGSAANPSHTSMPLNKFISHAGICSRRDAAELVKSGSVVVNGKQITEPGFKVSVADEIKLNGKKLNVQKNLVYILLNKPKDFLTTTEDPQGRKTVMDIVKNATPERVYPIGRLDRNTTGVLLLTNDGELAQKLSHPSYEIKKIYEVKLDRPLAKKDFDTILSGVELEDGFIVPDALAYADSKDKAVVGIEIHSGRNRIVRRIFEKLGYDVRNLDRVMYANLTKKNVERGKWRFLQEKEVRLLKFLNASLKKPNNPKQNG